MYTVKSMYKNLEEATRLPAQMQLPINTIDQHHRHTSKATTATVNMQFSAIFALSMAVLASAATSSHSASTSVSSSKGHSGNAKHTSTTVASSSTKKSKGVAPATNVPVLAAGGALGAAMLGFLV